MKKASFPSALLFLISSPVFAGTAMDLIANRFVEYFHDPAPHALQMLMQVGQPHIIDPMVESDNTQIIFIDDKGHRRTNYQLSMISDSEKECAIAQFNEYAQIAQSKLVGDLARAGIDLQHFAFKIDNHDRYTGHDGENMDPSLYANKRNFLTQESLRKRIGMSLETRAVENSGDPNPTNLQIIVFNLYRMDTVHLRQFDFAFALTHIGTSDSRVCFYTSADELQTQIQGRLAKAQGILDYEKLLSNLPPKK